LWKSREASFLVNFSGEGVGVGAIVGVGVEMGAGGAGDTVDKEDAGDGEDCSA
jgi:hypothetical protein